MQHQIIRSSNTIKSDWKDLSNVVNSAFEEFDEILSSIDSNMSVFKYNKIKSDAEVTVETDTVNNKFRYVVNIYKLSEAIDLNGYPNKWPVYDYVPLVTMD